MQLLIEIPVFTTSGFHHALIYCVTLYILMGAGTLWPRPFLAHCLTQGRQDAGINAVTAALQCCNSQLLYL